MASLKRTTIKKNKIWGEIVEGIIAEHIKGVLHDSSIDVRSELFDIRKGNRLIEVKSCAFRTDAPKRLTRKDGSPFIRHYKRKGRFVISTSSHKQLKSQAERSKMVAEYVFAVYNFKNGIVQKENFMLIREKRLSWASTDNFVKKAKSYTRNDKVINVEFPYSWIFPDML